MASDVHKKLVFGALGCGGLFVVVFAIGIVVSQDDIFKNGVKQQSYTLDDAIAAWDTLSDLSVTDSVAPPPLPPGSSPGPAAGGTRVIGVSRVGVNFPAVGDTFPAGSRERKAWADNAVQRFDPTSASQD